MASRYNRPMSDSVARGPEHLPELVPPAVLRICSDLSEAGSSAFLVGPGLRDLLRGARPPHYEVATNASLEALANLYPTAVLIDGRHGTVMIPTSAGPVDARPLRDGASVEDELSHRDFTVNALAYDPERETLLDPFGGRKHLEEGLLSAVGSARDRLSEDPLRALRGIRLTATLGWRLDPELETAFATVRGNLSRIPCEAVRRELVAIVLSEGVAESLARLEYSGLAAELAPGTARGAGAILALLPCDLELRLAGWLRGTRARRTLQKLRFSRPSVDRVDLLLRLHPLDVTLGTASAAARARLLRRSGSRNVAALIALRRAELQLDPDARASAREGLQRLSRIVEEVRSSRGSADRRDRLAIGGAEVMRALGCGPGPQVGRALAYLAAQVAADPSLNSPVALADLLASWSGGESSTI